MDLGFNILVDILNQNSLIYGFSSVGRALVSKTRCREFEPLNPCNIERIY